MTLVHTTRCFMPTLQATRRRHCYASNGRQGTCRIFPPNHLLDATRAHARSTQQLAWECWANTSAGQPVTLETVIRAHDRLVQAIERSELEVSDLLCRHERKGKESHHVYEHAGPQRVSMQDRSESKKARVGVAPAVSAGSPRADLLMRGLGHSAPARTRPAKRGLLECASRSAGRDHDPVGVPSSRQVQC